MFHKGQYKLAAAEFKVEKISERFDSIFPEEQLILRQNCMNPAPK
jgi:hypothetical protein